MVAWGEANDAFAVEYFESRVKVSKDDARTFATVEVPVQEKDIDKHIQGILMKEAVLFVNEFIGIMSPH